MQQQLKKKVWIRPPAAFVWRSTMKNNGSQSSYPSVITLTAWSASKWVVIFIYLVHECNAQILIQLIINRKWLIVLQRLDKLIAPSAWPFVFCQLKVLTLFQLIFMSSTLSNCKMCWRTNSKLLYSHFMSSSFFNSTFLDLALIRPKLLEYTFGRVRTCTVNKKQNKKCYWLQI